MRECSLPFPRPLPKRPTNLPPVEGSIFQNGKDALKAVESLQASSMIDGTKIDFRLDEKDLYLDNINDITD